MYEILNPRVPIQMGWEYEIAYQDRLRKPFSVLPEHFRCDFETINVQMDIGEQMGWEIKSPIASFSTHMRLIPTVNRTFDWTTKNGNGGGIHVNVNLNKYTEKHKSKVFIFMHRPDLRYKLQLLSGRDGPDFEHNCKRRSPGMYGIHHGIITDRKTGIDRLNRDRIVGNGCFELRMFKAKPELLPVSLQWTDAMYSLAPNVDKITLEHLHNYAIATPKYFKLANHMTETMRRL